MKRSHKLGACALAAGVLAAGGSAFTASSSGMPATDILGYGSTVVSGATVNSLAYTFNTGQSEIEKVVLVLDADTTASSVAVSFNDAAPTVCVGGVYDPGATETAYTCDNAGADFSFLTSSLVKTAVIVD